MSLLPKQLVEFSQVGEASTPDEVLDLGPGGLGQSDCLRLDRAEDAGLSRRNHRGRNGRETVLFPEDEVCEEVLSGGWVGSSRSAPDRSAQDGGVVDHVVEDIGWRRRRRRGERDLGHGLLIVGE